MIKNRSKNTVLAAEFTIHKNPLRRAKGLLFEETPRCLVFNTRFGIHTFLMKFPIDLLILDKNKKVVFLRENIPPRRIVLWNPIYDLVIELPKGSIKNSKTQLRDLVEFVS